MNGRKWQAEIQKYGKTYVLGVPLTVLDRKELMDTLKKAICEKRQLALVAINARKIIRTVHEPDMKDLLSGFDIFLADGASVVRAADHCVERITGIDLMTDICRDSEQLGAKLFFYGASDENNQAAQKKLKEKFPGMQIAGYCDGYDDADVLQRIQDSGANVVFVAKGTPLQEKWIIENRGKLPGVSILMGIGGALDVCCGKVKRAPVIFQKAGLEWLCRMIIEPKRFTQIPELLEFRKLIKRQKRMDMTEK